ncbi:putative bifunctional diguanylate cyclase/phosphodiesterase [Thiobacillus sedimenti]|uniref:EAL domain-containing protein n=1 Tax=Thiobacillus sedimenti TaxID=3110231 RepID=A0ABZ1CLA0_9PROT|nr:EAL domain-containing protein [Thiobacillus sp. SCUT-2]WRS40157.1 EAL domain-containing protein [Thiobacillus sp. SCUT-2]
MPRPTLPRFHEIRRAALIVGLAALAYALAGWASLKIAGYVAGVVAAVWLAAGIGAVASLRFGVAGVAGVLLGALAVYSRVMPAEGAAFLSLGAAAGAAITGYLPRHLPPFSATLDYVSSVAKFTLVAAPLGCAVSAMAGVASLHYLGILDGDAALRALWVWWLGDLLGVYLIAPLLLTASRWDLLPTHKAARLEALVLVLGMLLLTRVMMEYAEPLRPAEIVLFVLLPTVLWAALRFSVTGASVAIFLAALIVLGVSLVSFGGLTAATTARDVFALQVSMVTMALGGLFVSAALTERRYSEMRLDMLANHDPLTGLPNRSYFQDFLGHALARAQREKLQVSLLFIDLDRFKHINDSQGHEVGDQVLRVVAGRLDEQLRADDFVARLGGDEFAVVLMHPTTSRAASRVARKLLKAVGESFKVAQRRYAIGASIGISVYPDDGTDANTLLRQADLAMYQAKQRRSGFEYFSDELNTVAQQQMTLESGLRQAFERKELALAYQPKVDLASGRVVGLEALARWLPRSGGIIWPDQFVPVAEETGLIVPLGRWVLRAACEQWIAWRDAGLNPPPVAVNLSPRQFTDARLIEDIEAILQETGMDAGQLQLEVTESAAMENPARTFDMLDALRQRGLHIYIDDFGTGHSNLGQLKRMPIDALKIDKSFVNDVLRDGDDAEIVNAIIRLAHALNLRVVAEGVETQEQAAFLKQGGCDEIQGYVIAKPLPPDQASALFARQFAPGELEGVPPELE